MTINYTVIETPLGPILTAESGRGLVQIIIGQDGPAGLTAFCRKWFPDLKITPAAVDSAAQIQEYIQGTRREFDLALDLKGTDFQIQVWQGLREIPYGRTSTYGQVAREVGRPRSARAVGQACGANPIPLVVPCHRVLASGGGLGGFGSGLKWKKWLLNLEDRPAALEGH